MENVKQQRKNIWNSAISFSASSGMKKYSLDGLNALKEERFSATPRSFESV